MRKSFLLYLFITFFLLTVSVFADPPQPPPDPSYGSTNGPVGAPFENGWSVLLLITTGAVFGGINLWKLRKKLQEKIL